MSEKASQERREMTKLCWAALVCILLAIPCLAQVGPDGFLRQEVPSEFERLRDEVTTFPAGPLGPNPLLLEGIPGDAAEIEAEFAGGRFAAFGFEVRRSASGTPTVVVAIEAGMLTVGNASAYVGNSERYKIRLFLDKRCLEVYVNDGAVALYSAIDATLEGQVAVFARTANPLFGIPKDARRESVAVRLESLKAWPMRPASFSLDRFHV